MTRIVRLQVLDESTGLEVHGEAMQLSDAQAIAPASLRAMGETLTDRLIKQVQLPPAETRRDIRMVDVPCGGCDRSAGFSVHALPANLPRDQVAVDEWTCAFCRTRNVVPLVTK